MKLIVTCDDFGESHEVNERVVRGRRSRVIDRASLMVNAPGTAEALDLSERFRLPIGLHFWLGDSFWQALANSFSRRHVENELVRQMGIVRKLKPHHFDSHFHVHLLPWVATAVGPRMKLPIRGGKVTIGPAKASIIGLFAGRFPTFDYLIDLDWFPKLSPDLIRSIFSQIPPDATVEVIVHPQKGKSLEWFLTHGPLHRYTRL